MKIAVLEWICGGGMSSTPLSEIALSLRHEGAAMLNVLLRALRDSGCHVTTAVDHRMLDSHPWAAIEILTVKRGSALVENGVPAEWLTLASDADFSIVIAPELDSLLERSLAVLRGQSPGRREIDRDGNGNVLLNCIGPFLENACDKLRTATRLSEHRVPHPPTIVLSEVDESWLNEFPLQQWVLKPRDGAGSEDIDICDQAQILACRQRVDTSRFIVQPRLVGDAFSCSAIVDRAGTCHWLPLMHQELDAGFKYRGGRVADEAMQRKRPLELLSNCIAAMGPTPWGWIGADLIYEAESDSWTVIEINPRLTTSVIGHARLLNGSLGKLLCDAFEGSCPVVEIEPQSLRFLASGEICGDA